MNRKHSKLDGVLLGGGIALGLSGLLFVTVTARAVMTSPLPTLTALATPVEEGDRAQGVMSEGQATGPSGSSERTVPREVVPSEVLRTAVEGAPFQPDRQAPSARYRLPDEPLPALPMLPPPPPELPAPPAFRLLGTIAGGGVADGAVIVLAVDDNAPQILGLGESYMGYTVAQVVGDRAMLTGQGRNLALTVSGAAATVASAAGQQNRGGNANPRGNNTQNGTPAQQLQELLRGGRGQNLTPEQRQRLMREAEGAAQELLQQILRGGGQGGQQGGQGGQRTIQFRIPGAGGAATVIQGGGQAGQGGAVQRQIIVRPGGGGD